MKKLLIFLLLPICFAAGAQSICLQTQCVATAARVGDTAAIGAVLTAANGYSGIVYKLVSGPNTPVIITPKATYNNTTQMQQNLGVTGLVSGTYVFQVTGTDTKGGTVVGADSIVVTPGCPVVVQRTVVSLTLTLFGQTITVPAGSLPAGAIKYSDGSNQ